MFAKPTLAAAALLTLGTIHPILAQTSNTPKPKPAPRIVFDIPQDTLNDTAPTITRLSPYDPTPEQIRD